MCSTWPGECLINPRMEHYGKFEDKSLITEVLVAMPAREENTHLLQDKNSRKVPTDRDSYDPAPILTAIPGGDRAMVLDLSENWKDEEFRDLISTTSLDEE